ncbi:hypothetical protein SS50377_26245 [Spironucleus salmonicida]|uniref:Uncharacterized protein n=1 Tax=Spironucleus salmonicida TaxID=348837 RepID=V6LV21_9EUKA|nr:hypothetical protein SS50377_26245 [Spironucleus salmonicida]|eukprot:EST48098.1 Hypothetical protein SS50377_11761 [Spironucleus salmonicida]
MQFVLTVTSQLLLFDDIQFTEDRFYNPQIIENCFAINTILEVNIDTGQICVVFDMQYNPDCDQILHGIYLDIQVSNCLDSVIRGQILKYNYKEDGLLCYYCPLIGSDSTCKFIQETLAATIYIKSLSKMTNLPVGQIIIAHPINSGCYDDSLNQVFWSTDKAIIDIYLTGQCPNSDKDIQIFIFYLYDLDNQIIELNISGYNELGDLIYNEESIDNRVQITVNYDFSKYVLDNFNQMKVMFYIKFSTTTIIKTAYISLIQSSQLDVMYINVTFTVWAGRFSLIADRLENAVELNALFIPQMRKIRLRYQIFSIITADTIDNLFF